jgi:hypothetical protein
MVHRVGDDRHGVQEGRLRQTFVRLIGLIAVFICIFLYVSLFKNALIDDVFISLKYSQNLASFGTWGFFPGRITNTATSPLNVILTAIIGLVAPSMVDAAIWLASGELMLIFVVLMLTSERLFDGYYYGAIAFVGLIANPLLLSTLGLESILFTLWITVSIYLFVSRRWLALAAALALLTMTRADGALLFAVFLLALPVSFKTRLQFVLAYAIVLTPWHLYSWIHLGSVIPDTMKIKMFQRDWGRWLNFRNGPALYLQAFPLAFTFSILLLPFGLLCIAVKAGKPVRTVAAILAAYGALHFIAYSTIRVPPYHWYYVSEAVTGVLMGSLGLSSVFHRYLDRERLKPLFWLTVLAPAAGIVAIVATTGFRVDEMPIHSNWATHDRYKQMGLWLRDHAAPDAGIFCSAEIGTIAFYSGKYLINEFSDMNRISEPILKGTYNNLPVVGILLRVNYYWRRLQDPLPPIKYWVQATLTVNEKQRAALDVEAIHAWDVSTRFTEWLTPGRKVRYWFNASTSNPADGTR